jgi:hypothetical protein
LVITGVRLENHLRSLVKDRNDKPERGSEWELIKIFLDGDRGSNKKNTASKTRL